ncbi:receptor-like protein 34 [Alnus glutinosa]|uniref:receptor-like protein 34 n=1 Tax=Alnus glutinosa TaxID=3517 RepID=UPI002D78E6D7|nr:receptor-like protein 34 [Alnus glutinosa]
MTAICSASGDLPPASSDLTPCSHVPPSQLRLGQPSTASNTACDFQRYEQFTAVGAEFLNCFNCVSTPLCLEDERSALLQFKDSFVINKSASPDPSACSKLASWTLEGEHGDCCLWDGRVYCNEETVHVIDLDLSGSCLYGSFNSNSSVFRLFQLQRLNLAYNDFNDSQIPSAVGNLSMLTYLNLSYSVFSGQIPESLANLSSLTTLDLDYCQLHGEFPARIFQLPNLVGLLI